MLPDRAMTTPMTKTMHPIDASDTWRTQRAYENFFKNYPRYSDNEIQSEA